jgi:hypothetical protein
MRNPYWAPEYLGRKPLVNNMGCFVLNPNHRLNRNLARWWMINEGAGKQIFDLVNRKHLAMAGTVPWNRRARGEAAGVFSTSNYFSLADTSITAEPLTLMVWAYQPSSLRQVLLSLGNNGTYGAFYLLFKTNTTYPQAGAGKQGDGGNSVNEATATPSSSYPNWYNVTGVFRNTTWMNGYCNGVAYATPVTTDRGAVSVDYITLGAYRKSTVTEAATQDYVAEAAIWTRGLTDEEVMELYRWPYGIPGNPRLIYAPRAAYFIPAAPAIIYPNSWHPAIEQPVRERIRIVPY